MSAHERAVEAAEILGILKASKFAVFVETLQREPDCFTRGGRINCASVARHLGVEPNVVSGIVREMRTSASGCF